MTKLAIAVLGIIASQACTPTRVQAPPSPPLPAHWQHAPSTTSHADTDLQHWWQGFGDPVLNRLISQALAANHDLNISKARVREAQALATISAAALYPTVDFSLSGGREKDIQRVIGVPSQQGIALTTPTGDSVVGGLSASWEIDVFGSRQLAAEASTALTEAIIAERHAVQVGVLAQVSSHYFAWRGLQARIAIQQRAVAVQQQRLHALQAYSAAGLSLPAEVSAQHSLVQAQASLLAQLELAAETQVHQLAVLLGVTPSVLEPQLAALPKPTTAPTTPPLPTLLPAEWLVQRPDLASAQHQVMATAAQLGVAKADLLPKFVLATSAGLGTLAVGGFSSLAETVYRLGAGLSAPLFNGGRIRANITAADARLQQAAQHYEQTLLRALADVDTAYATEASARLRLGQLQLAVAAAQSAETQAGQLYENGASPYLAVLDAELNKLKLKDELAKTQTDLHMAAVSLYRSLGGGWDRPSALSTRHTQK